MRERLAAGLAGLAWVFCSPAFATDYAIVWKQTAFPKAHVTAHLQSPDCMFTMSNHWADFFSDKRGWTRFVSGMEAHDGANKLAVVAQDGSWRVGEARPCSVTLDYDVDFSLGRQQWEPGNEQVMWSDDRAVYATGLPIFVLGGDTNKPISISVAMPDGWSVATPWTPSADGFVARDRDALLNNTIVFGRTFTHEFRAEDLTITAALLGDYSRSSSILTDAFTKLVPDYVEMFGENQHGRYMFAVIPGPDDGESFTDSFAVATAEAPTDANRIVWANHLSHELLHYWIGGKLAPSESDGDSLQWFTEGFTEYLANRALLDEHIYTAEQYRDQMGRHLGEYLMTRDNPNFSDITPTEAGAHKWRNRPLVYSGGAAIAYCLDASIRKGSNGRHTIRDMMRGLFARHAPLTFSAIKSEASRTAQTSLDTFFDDYVAGKKTLPLKECAASLGDQAYTHNYDVFLYPPRADGIRQ